MNLQDFLSNKGSDPKGKETDWLYFSTLTIKSGQLWAGDPHTPGAAHGCVVKLAPGQYIVEGTGMVSEGDRIVARLRVRLEGSENPTLGKSLGDTGTDSAMIGVCDIKAFEKIFDQDNEEEVQEAIEEQTGTGFGVMKFKDHPDAIMPFVPTGSDGTGPVFALMSGRKQVGIELPFDLEEEAESDENVAEIDPELLSFLGDDDTFITRNLNGKEVAFWLGGDLVAGKKIYIWSNATQGPVEYRIKQKSGTLVQDWAAMKEQTGGGGTYCATQVLQAGNYEIDFLIANESFSGLKVTLK